MLILSRHPTEIVKIGDDITLTVLSVTGGEVRLGIEAPRHIPVYRQEIYRRIQSERQAGEEARASAEDEAAQPAEPPLPQSH